jgi:hypothetical protein
MTPPYSVYSWPPELGDFEKPALQRQEAAGWDLSLVPPERMINHDERGVNSERREELDWLDSSSVLNVLFSLPVKFVKICAKMNIRFMEGWKKK